MTPCTTSWRTPPMLALAHSACPMEQSIARQLTTLSRCWWIFARGDSHHRQWQINQWLVISFFHREGVCIFITYVGSVSFWNYCVKPRLNLDGTDKLNRNENSRGILTWLCRIILWYAHRYYLYNCRNHRWSQSQIRLITICIGFRRLSYIIIISWI